MDEMTPQQAEVSTETTAKRPRKAKKRRRGRGEGAIWQKPNGSWVATVMLGRDAEGRRLRRSVTGKTKEEVIAKLHDLREGKRRGTVAAPSAWTVSTWIDHWLELRAGELERRTWVEYEGLVKRQIKPTALAGVRLAALAPIHVTEWQRALEQKGVGAATRHNAFKVLSAGLQAATQPGVGILGSNPCKQVRPPKWKVAKRPWLQPEQVQALLAIVASESASVRAFVTLLVTTGMRFGEIAGLQWSSVDLRKGVVSVERSLSEVNGKVFLKGTKSAAGHRQIAIPEISVEALAAHRGATSPLPNTLVFVRQDGSPLRRGDTLSIWHRILAKAGIEKMGFHAARRGHVSALVSRGADLRAISSRIGHANVSFTVQVYAQISGEADRRLSDLVGELVAAPKAKAVQSA